MGGDRETQAVENSTARGRRVENNPKVYNNVSFQVWPLYPNYNLQLVPCVSTVAKRSISLLSGRVWKVDLCTQDTKVDCGTVSRRISGNEQSIYRKVAEYPGVAWGNKYLHLESCFYIFLVPFRGFLFFRWSAVSELALWSIATFRGES